MGQPKGSEGQPKKSDSQSEGDGWTDPPGEWTDGQMDFYPFYRTLFSTKATAQKRLENTVEQGKGIADLLATSSIFMIELKKCSIMKPHLFSLFLSFSLSLSPFPSLNLMVHYLFRRACI